MSNEPVELENASKGATAKKSSSSKPKDSPDKRRATVPDLLKHQQSFEKRYSHMIHKQILETSINKEALQRQMNAFFPFGKSPPKSIDGILREEETIQLGSATITTPDITNTTANSSRNNSSNYSTLDNNSEEMKILTENQQRNSKEETKEDAKKLIEGNVKSFNEETKPKSRLTEAELCEEFRIVLENADNGNVEADKVLEKADTLDIAEKGEVTG